MALQVCFPKSYVRAVQATESNRGSISEQEQRIFGLDHTVAGRRLALHWRLPAMIAECIWLHHQGPESTPTRIATAGPNQAFRGVRFGPAAIAPAVAVAPPSPTTFQGNNVTFTSAGAVYTQGAPTGRFIAPAGFGNCQQGVVGGCGFNNLTHNSSSS